MNGASMMLFPAVLVIAALGIAGVVRKVRRGSSCCGEHEAAEKRVRVADRDPSHYAHHYVAEIGGMVCANCVRRVENVFNREEGLWAIVDLARKKADIYAKRELSRDEAYQRLQDVSYTLLDWHEEVPSDESAK